VKPARDRHLVYCIGPSGSGKTTWLQTSLPDGYLVFDRSPHLDVLLRGRRNYYADATATANAMIRAGLAQALERGLNLGVALGGRSRAERAKVIGPARAAGYRVTLYLFLVPVETCIARCRADPARPKTARWHLIVPNWYKNFEPVEGDEGDELVNLVEGV